MLSAVISLFDLYKSSITAFSRLHVAKVAVQGTKSDDVKTEQGTRLSGHILLRDELRQDPNDSSLLFPYTGVRYRRCFGVDSCRNINNNCRIIPVLFPVIERSVYFCKVCKNATPLNGPFDDAEQNFYHIEIFTQGLGYNCMTLLCITIG